MDYRFETGETCFSVAKATLETQMSVWNQNPSASWNQAYMPISYHAYLSATMNPLPLSAIMPISNYSYSNKQPSCLLAIISIYYLSCFRDF